MDISAYQHMNIRMSTRGKRPLRNLTPSDKVRAIQRIHNGETKASVSRDIGVPESTLRGWCKNEQKLRFMCRQLGVGDQITAMQCTENPPEKRTRFDNHNQTPKYSVSPSFDEFGFNSLPLSGLSFPSNGSNTILEKIALNEIMKKHSMLTADSFVKPPGENISVQMSDTIGTSLPATGDFNSQLSMMQNLNFLTLLSPNVSAMSNSMASDIFGASKNKSPLRIVDETKNNTKNNSNSNINITTNKNISNSQNCISLSVKNWAKEKPVLSFTNQNHINNVSSNTATKSNHTAVNDSNNNQMSDKISSLPSTAISDVLTFSPPVPLNLLQIPNVNSTCISESGSNTALLEWCKIFNASLNFLALAAAAAALQPNECLSVAKSVKKEDNILYKELAQTSNWFDSTNNQISFVSSDLSNDSYFESEPEDLSVRSTVTSKLSSPSNSRPESPVKSNASSSPLHSDGER